MRLKSRSKLRSETAGRAATPCPTLKPCRYSKIVLPHRPSNRTECCDAAHSGIGPIASDGERGRSVEACFLCTSIRFGLW